MGASLMILTFESPSFRSFKIMYSSAYAGFNLKILWAIDPLASFKHFNLWHIQFHINQLIKWLIKIKYKNTTAVFFLARSTLKA